MRLGRVSPPHLALDAGGQHGASQFGAAAAATVDAVRNLCGYRNKENKYVLCVCMAEDKMNYKMMIRCIQWEV